MASGTIVLATIGARASAYDTSRSSTMARPTAVGASAGKTTVPRIRLVTPITLLMDRARLPVATVPATPAKSAAEYTPRKHVQVLLATNRRNSGQAIARL